MTALTFIAFAGSLALLFMTPGPGVIAIIGRTLNRGPWHGVAYGIGITLGDIFWLTIVITGLSAAANAASEYESWFWVARLIGASILFVFAYQAFKSFRQPKPLTTTAFNATSKLGLFATMLAGISMPLSNPKAIAFYLSFVPAFFDLTLVGPVEYALMVAILLVLSMVFVALYVGLSHHMRDWLATRGIKRWADLFSAVLMTAIAVVLLVR